MVSGRYWAARSAEANGARGGSGAAARAGFLRRRGPSPRPPFRPAGGTCGWRGSMDSRFSQGNDWRVMPPKEALPAPSGTARSGGIAVIRSDGADDAGGHSQGPQATISLPYFPDRRRASYQQFCQPAHSSKRKYVVLCRTFDTQHTRAGRGISLRKQHPNRSHQVLW